MAWRRSANDGISKEVYPGTPVSLRYPSVDDMLDLVVMFGPGCLLFKTDMLRAYRQIPVCPGDARGTFRLFMKRQFFH